MAREDFPLITKGLQNSIIRIYELQGELQEDTVLVVLPFDEGIIKRMKTICPENFSDAFISNVTLKDGTNIHLNAVARSKNEKNDGYTFLVFTSGYQIANLLDVIRQMDKGENPV